MPDTSSSSITEVGLDLDLDLGLDSRFGCYHKKQFYLKKSWTLVQLFV